MSVSDRNVLLSGFLKFMGLERERIAKGRLENGIKAQKFVYFGKKLGLPLDYDFDLYLYVPYSSKLSSDYYNMSIEEWDSGSLKIPKEMESNLRTFFVSDALYLEIAATLDSVRTANKGVSDDKLIEVVSKLKPNRLNENDNNSEWLKDVLNDIKHFYDN